jgi:hypothetical protein
LQAKASARDETAAATEAKRQEAHLCVFLLTNLLPAWFFLFLCVEAACRYVELIRSQVERKKALEDAANGLVIVKAVCVVSCFVASLPAAPCPTDVVVAGTAW